MLKGKSIRARTGQCELLVERPLRGKMGLKVMLDTVYVYSGKLLLPSSCHRKIVPDRKGSLAPTVVASSRCRGGSGSCTGRGSERDLGRCLNLAGRASTERSQLRPVGRPLVGESVRRLPNRLPLDITRTPHTHTHTHTVYRLHGTVLDDW